MVSVIIYIFERKGMVRTMVTRAHTFSEKDLKEIRRFGWDVKKYVSQIAGSPVDIREFVETAR